MRVVLFSATEAFGGLELHLIALAEHLIARGHRAHVVVLGRDVFAGRLNVRPELQLTIVRDESPIRPMSLAEAKAMVQSLEGDVCVFEKGAFECGSLGLDIASRRRFRRYITIEQLEADPLPPLVVGRHLGGLVPGLGLWWYQRRFRGYLRSAGPQSIICVSQAVQRKLRDQYWFPRRKMSVASNGVDVERFVRRSDWRRKARADWGVGDGTVVFGAVGRFAPVKGYDLGLEAFAAMARDQGTDVRLVLFGEGPDETMLRERARQLGVAELVVFRPFIRRPEEVLSGFDFFVMPSRNEGLPFALMEAMSCGCAPIAMRVGGIGEIITSRACGWLIEPGDAAAFLAAMREGRALPAEARERVAAAARARIVSHFNIREQLTTITSFIER